VEDREGGLWFGTVNGVSRYDGGDFTTFTTNDGLADNHVRSIVEDGEGNLWFATRRGVSRYDGRKFQTITVRDGLSCKNIRSILEDREGYLWFGTNGGGVCKMGKIPHTPGACDGYDGTNFQEITTRDGLAHDTVRQIMQDRAGKFWFATPNRVTRYTPPRHKVKPRVCVTQAIADRVYEDPDDIESSAKQVIFGYKGLSFKTEFDRIKYIHRLQGPINPEIQKSRKPESRQVTTGSDSDWSQATRERRVRYENLELGEYLFQVRAIDRDLNYSDVAQVKLTVVPDPRNGHIARLEEQLREQERAEMERIYQELEDARQIQKSLLPKEPPQIEGFEIAGTSISAREVSGDFYDYLWLGENVGIVLADVSGKSVRAAMVAAMANGMLHTEVKGQREIWYSPGKILRELNIALQPRLIPSMFTTMSLGILQPGRTRLLLSNAGMPYAIVKRGGEIWELEVSGFPLGLMDGAEYTDLGVDLKVEDFVLFYSDGVSEAGNEAGEIYQTERLMDVLREADPGLSAQEMVDLIVNDVTRFAGDMDASDDITVVVLRCVRSDKE